jgi:hypothetical protein
MQETPLFPSSTGFFLFLVSLPNENIVFNAVGSFITCIEHRYAVVLLGFSGRDAIFSLM